MNADKLKKISDLAAALDKLAATEEWPVLRRYAEKKLERLEKSLWTKLMAGGQADQREIDRLIGFRAGINWFLENPEKAEASLKAALRKATTLEEGDNA